ncbi:MAG: sugar transferase [Planctomycetia bacterium]|nr:sugar transferase [Planctomycetia bacterium]
MGPTARATKRLLDVTMSVMALALLFPFLIVIGLLIRLGSRGPAIFRQERAGKDMRPFTLYKFRTMRTDADVFGVSPKEAEDPRLTRLGRFLREYSLDELPQLWNVLRGNMSLVGPRPLYMSQAREFTPRQRKRLSVKPGLTGLTQVTARGKIPHEEKLEIDVQYVEQLSLGFDFRIVLRTMLNVFRKQGIYQEWE